MNAKRIIWASAAIAAVAATGFWYQRSREERTAPAFRFTTVAIGDVESTVAATGTLGAVTTVAVGTQVSGQVQAIYADFNSRVKKGQLIARIDPTLAEQAVREAEAGVARTRADLDKATRDHGRAVQLHASQVISDDELYATEHALAVARASLASAQVSEERARRNLSYTRIYAPIDGIVIERNVDVGQTVAASLQAPQLFLIANDLSEMQILAAVDESDIGAIVAGNPVRFTVQAYPAEQFIASVDQVRLQSQSQENVVSYTVVVSVANRTGRLLPGMTATVRFLTGSASNVLIVPNAALRYTPSADLLARVGAAPMLKVDTARAETLRVVAKSGRGAGGGGSGGAELPSRSASRADTLWYVNSDGLLAALPVATGITDGQQTEVAGPGLAAGLRVITAVAQASSGATTTSPFQTGGAGAGPPRPGF